MIKVMFSARCKMYRYDKEAKMNPERGLIFVVGL